MRDPALVDVDDSLVFLVHVQHLLRVQAPQHLIPLQVSLEGNSSDLLVREIELSLKHTTDHMSRDDTIGFFFNEALDELHRPDRLLLLDHPSYHGDNCFLVAGSFQLFYSAFHNGRLRTFECRCQLSYSACSYIKEFAYLSVSSCFGCSHLHNLNASFGIDFR